MGAQCVHAQPACSGSDDCGFDSYCLQGVCVPYELPEGYDHDPLCVTSVTLEAISPAVQCRWSAPPAGDPFPDNDQVMATPIVVDFDFDSDPKTLSPSIVFASFPVAGNYSEPGVLRVIRGDDCTQQWTVNDVADGTMAPAPVAVGDLDGDGRAEIVAVAHHGGLIAFRWEPSINGFTRYFRSGKCLTSAGPPTTFDKTGGDDQWSGPSIHDLDNDGVPEIIYGTAVYRANGCLVSDALGFPQYYKGVVPVIANVDDDPGVELVEGNGVYEWNVISSSWKKETYFKGTSPSIGQVAIADFGNFPLTALNGKDGPEIAVIAGGKARVQTLEGTVIFGPVTIPGGGFGGPPTIADFDGDGRREFASAGGSQYVVFDLDCVDETTQGCAPDSAGSGIRWSQPSQDQTSFVTGSSVFDFDADGAAEAVYADECFLRIYDGATGSVIYSTPRSSGTTLENPVIVDVDGDYRTEIVAAVNDYWDTNCPSHDPLFPATAYESGHGIVVLRDESDSWAASRPIWNQHAYAVTNVTDTGTIPASTAVQKNWTNPSLNNFRQNVQGGLAALGQPDLTAGGQVGAVLCAGTMATIPARVCNRGTLPMVGGTKVAFSDAATKSLLCDAAIPVALQVGGCIVVSCEADLHNATVDVAVMVDPDSATLECHENNNGALYTGVACGKVPR